MSKSLQTGNQLAIVGLSSGVTAFALRLQRKGDIAQNNSAGSKKPGLAKMTAQIDSQRGRRRFTFSRCTCRSGASEASNDARQCLFCRTRFVTESRAHFTLRLSRAQIFENAGGAAHSVEGF